ncbi:hypothetical protein B0H21DRAFT_735808 [Amylocystis lapponica]|nr:hypothetical protein B0H21DRAFT_735808 [Amylocystis lapponica]
MIAESFSIPVLLVPPVGSATSSASDSPEKYRYLTSVPFIHTPPTISEMHHDILQSVRKNAGKLNLGIHPLSEMKLTIHELVQSLRPAVKTDKNLAEAYEIVNDQYLYENGFTYNFDHLLGSVGNLENLVAILHIVPPAGPTLTTVQEVNESSAQLRREHIATAAKMRKSPSTGAHTADRIVTQNPTRVDAVYNYRPIDLAPPPITLYHPVFAKFLQLMAEPQEFTKEELIRAHSFVTLAVAYYRDEATRRETLYCDMSTAIHESILVLGPDGVVSSEETLDGFSPVTAIHEVKLEIGDGGCDPLAQGECDYVAIYSSNEARLVREVCCCPAFIIGMAGPNIVVSGAVFVDQLPNGRSPLDDAGYRVARLFRALKVCIMDLDEYYSKLVQTIYSPPERPVAGVLGGRRPTRRRILDPPSMIGPHFTTYCDDSGEEVMLTYKARLIPDLSVKAIFVAEAKSASETATVVVKFAYKYNREAHNLLATASPQQAPNLRYCAYEASVRMQVVVMDYVEGEEVDDVLTQPAHIESLRRALTALHANDFVFGDLRAPNVLIVDDRVVLVDFDWCGKAGEARYPSDIALGAEISMWHGRVERGGLIEKAHDEYHFRALTKEDL